MSRITLSCRIQAGQHPAGAEGLWGTGNEVPSFLYGMPLGNGRVFLEETCLVSKPGLPFATLKRRLERRLDAMGLKVRPFHVHVNASSAHAHDTMTLQNRGCR